MTTNETSWADLLHAVAERKLREERAAAQAGTAWAQLLHNIAPRGEQAELLTEYANAKEYVR